MEKPYRYRKKLVKLGHSAYVIVPITSLASWAKILKVKKVTDVIMEIYEDRIVITPSK